MMFQAKNKTEINYKKRNRNISNNLRFDNNKFEHFMIM